jgi:hypothetical protein
MNDFTNIMVHLHTISSLTSTWCLTHRNSILHLPYILSPQI